jgi:type IV pilus assembly protein PilB
MVKFNEEKQDKQLAELHRKEEEELAKILSEKYGVKYQDLTQTSINTDALRLISEKESRALGVALVAQIGKKLSMAVHSPNKPEVSDLQNSLEKRGYSIEIIMVSTKSLERAWSMYKDISFAVETKAGVIDVSGKEIQKILEKLHSLEDVKVALEDVLKMKKSYRISRILEVMLAGASAVGSSDIHLEPEEKKVRLRYRLDGVLTDIVAFDNDTYRLMLSRMKLLSGLKLNVRNEAQDGRFSIAIDDKSIEVRTSVIPDAYGESVVMRLLNPDSIQLSLPDLGMEPRLLEVLMREIKKPNGLLITTGPTGSGKTTTLYAFLRTIHRPEIKIITIEDPVEYHLEGIVQTQVEENKYTFGSGLRAALRQDPDVIMVGEIRDEEVAETAIHSALTGHLVFSTLHTNNAAGAIPRLVGLGIDRKIIGSAVNVIMAQRLVRKLCETCKKEIKLEGANKKIVEKIISEIHHKESVPTKMGKLWEPGGCEKCNDSGYKGRIGLYEAIVIDEKIADLVTENPSEYELMRAASTQGILTMRQDGVVKALRGITTLSEIDRVISLEEGSTVVEEKDERRADDIMIDAHDKTFRNPSDDPLKKEI